MLRAFLNRSPYLAACLIVAGCNTFGEPDPFRGSPDSGANDGGTTDGGQPEDGGETEDSGAGDATTDMSPDMGPNTAPSLGLSGYETVRSWTIMRSGISQDIRVASGETGSGLWLSVATRDEVQTSRIEHFLLKDSAEPVQFGDLTAETRVVLSHDLKIRGRVASSSLVYAGVGYEDGCTDSEQSEWGWRRIFDPNELDNGSLLPFVGECGDPDAMQSTVTGEITLFEVANLEHRMASHKSGNRVLSINISGNSGTYLEADLSYNPSTERLRGAPGGVLFAGEQPGSFTYWAGMWATDDSAPAADETRLSGPNAFYTFTIDGADRQVFDIANTDPTDHAVLFGRLGPENVLFVDPIDAIFTTDIAGNLVDGLAETSLDSRAFEIERDVTEIAAHAFAGSTDYFAVYGHGDQSPYGLRMMRYTGQTPVSDENVFIADIDWPSEREIVSLDLHTSRLPSGNMLLSVGISWASSPENQGNEVYVYELRPTN